jgi:hypothetical protein
MCMMVSGMALTAEMPPSLLKMEGVVVALPIPLLQKSFQGRGERSPKGEGERERGAARGPRIEISKHFDVKGYINIVLFAKAPMNKSPPTLFWSASHSI